MRDDFPSKGRAPVAGPDPLLSPDADGKGGVVPADAGKGGQSGPVGWALFVLLCINLVKGGSVLAIKLGLEDLPPILSAGIRFTSAGLIVGMWSLSKGGVRGEGPDSLRHRFLPDGLCRWLLAAALLMSFAYALFYSALELSFVSRTALFVNLNPFFVAVLAAVFLHERLGFGQWFGIGLAFSGVLLVEWHSLVRYGWSRFGPADLLVLGSGLAWASQAVVKKHIARRVRPEVLTFWEVLLPGLFLLTWGTLVEGWGRVHWSAGALWSLAYLVIPGTVGAFVAFNWVLQRADASRIVPFSFIIPVTAFILGATVRNEPISPDMAGAVVMVAVGLWAVSRWKSNRS